MTCIGDVLPLTRASSSLRFPVRQRQSPHLTWLQTPPGGSNAFSGPVPRSPAPLPGPVLLAALVWCHPPSGTPICGCPFRPVHSLALYCELSPSALPGAVCVPNSRLTWPNCLESSSLYELFICTQEVEPRSPWSPSPLLRVCSQHVAHSSICQVSPKWLRPALIFRPLGQSPDLGLT